VAEGEIEARGAGSIPAYATFCKNAAAYSSACSCIGVTAATVTSTPTVTAYAPDVTIGVCPKAGETNCGGTCYDLGTSTTNCGVCGNSVRVPCPKQVILLTQNIQCSPGEVCNAGTGSCTVNLDLYKCNAPVACGNTQCGGGCGACFPDTSGQGWCMHNNDCGPPATTVCTTNLDCGSGICIQSCCGLVCVSPEANMCFQH
jgi:hypothetical protein